VAADALALGRYSVACGCVGMAQACLDLSVEYVRRRKQFGVLIQKHQLIRRLLSDMVVDVRAARLLCRETGECLQQRSPDAIMETAIAKYASSRAAMDAATAAVQIRGAAGCLEGQPAERFFRDAKVMEIIEGTTQIHQITIARHGLQEYARRRRARRSPDDA
jgi:alkylation response protein AidB-like acyl-CoA dehydrogenase